MSKPFIAFDGADKTGVRAEVKVELGTGTIKEILIREGKKNAEIVFKPDNPQLIRKVGAYIDTEKCSELYAYIQKAYAEGSTVAYRIESQRKAKVDRSKTLEELKATATTDIVRILARIDNVRSPEAVTNPNEDPQEGRVDAGDAPVVVNTLHSTNASQSFAVDKDAILSKLAEVRQEGYPESIIDILIAQALIAGATLTETNSAGFSGELDLELTTNSRNTRVAALEEKPWNAHNSDGRPNAGSYMVTHAATAEQFALDHLIYVYSQTGSKPSKTPIQVTEDMIAQAASSGLQILKMADEVQISITSNRPNRQKNSYGRALNLVMDAISKRFHIPVGGNEQARAEWQKDVITESSERLYGVMEIAHDRLPLSLEERASAGATSQNTKAPEPTEATKPEPAKTIVDSKVALDKTLEADPRFEVLSPKLENPQSVSTTVANAAAMLGGKVVSPKATETPLGSSTTFPKKGDAGFAESSPEQIQRLREICGRAGLIGNNHAIVAWMQKNTGEKVAKEIHGQALEQWLVSIESLSDEKLKELTAELM